MSDFKVTPIDTMPVVFRTHNFASREGTKEFLEKFASVSYYMCQTSLDMAFKLIKWQEENQILIGWLDGPGVYYFNKEQDMNFFLLSFPEFKRVY